jgi:flagellar FliL protein
MKADPKAEAAAPNGKKKMLVMIIAGVLVLGLGGGAAWFLTRPADDAKAKPKVEESGPPQYVPLEQFTVNLVPEQGEQYLQIQFTLQVSSPEQVELLKVNSAKVRSRVLLLLSGKKASEIATVAGKAQLAKELIDSLNQPFVDKGAPNEVKEVLFTQFIIQ